MKVNIWLLLIIHTSSILIITNGLRYPIYAPLHVISLKDITADERRQIAYLEKKLERAKRSGSSGSSGSGEIFNALKNAIGNGIKKKLGQLTMASAAASGTFSKTSSSGGHKTEYYDHPPIDHSYESHSSDGHSHKSFDFWDLKKSILNTLLQAVKAIKGGAIAVKGQLIKGGGKLVSASGQLVSSQGDAITHLGKQIATSAVLVPWMGSSSKGHPHSEYEPEDHHHSAPSAPEEIYHHSPPSGPSEDYHVRENYREGTAGLLILKKVSGQAGHHRQYYSPSFNGGQNPSSPSFGTIAGKFFSASSSLDPQKPELFGDRPTGHDDTDSYQAYMVQSNYGDNEVIPSASGVVKQEIPSPYVPQKTKKPTTFSSKTYGLPFKKSPNKQNVDNIVHAASNNQMAAHNTYIDSLGPNENTEEVPQDYFINNSLDSQKNADNFLKDVDPRGQSSSFEYQPLQGSKNPLGNIEEYPNIRIPDSDYLSPPISDLISTDSTGLQNSSLLVRDILKPHNNSQAVEEIKSSPSPYLETPKVEYFIPTIIASPPTKSTYTPMGFLKSPSNYFFGRFPSSSNHLGNKNPPYAGGMSESFDLVPSVSYEIGPNGPIKLT